MYTIKPLTYDLPMVSRYFFCSWIMTVYAMGGALATAQDSNFQTQKKKIEVELDLNVGVEYDTNVAISDIDLASGLDDFAFLFRAKGTLRHQLTDHALIKSNYVYSLKDYDSFSRFDQQIHLANIDFSQQLGDLKLGIVGRYLSADLDGQKYLEAYQFSPYISRFFGRKYFGRAYYTYSDKSYDSRPERDGEVHSVGIDGYHFLAGTREFLTLSYKFEGVSAFEQQLAYDKHRFQAQYIRKVPIMSEDSTLRFSAKYEARDYNDINFVINDIRHDDRFTYAVSWEIPIIAKTYLEFDLKYRDYNSNLPLVDYNKTVFGVKVGRVF